MVQEILLTIATKSFIYVSNHHTFFFIKVFLSFLSVPDFGLGTGATDINSTNTILNVGRNWVDKSRCPGRMAIGGSWLGAGGQGPLAEDTSLFSQNSVGTKPGMDRELCK